MKNVGYGSLALASLVFLLAVVTPREASAGYFELSGGFSYSASSYGRPGDFEWIRRFNFSLGYHFTERTEIEISFQDAVDRTSIQGYQDTTFHDQTYTAAWVQSFLGKDSFIDPYFKLGMGQLNHTARGTYSFFGTVSADAEVDSLTEVIGIGVRFNITKRFGLRLEGDTYITDFKISTWQNNAYFMAGFSFYF